MSDQPPAITREQVAYLAGLARIDLTDAELDHLAPSSHPLPLTNVFRLDRVVPGLSAADALAGAPEAAQQRFQVPRILGEDA
jgi:aspartyl-tRNA(Asn)/glutamyl-tRNA(Gln) amidotransferase subunit C